MIRILIYVWYFDLLKELAFFLYFNHILKIRFLEEGGILKSEKCAYYTEHKNRIKCWEACWNPEYVRWTFRSWVLFVKMMLWPTSVLLGTLYLLFSCFVMYDNPMDYTILSFPALHYLPEFAETQVLWVGGTIQPYHSLLPPFLPVLHLSCISSELALHIRWPQY